MGRYEPTEFARELRAHMEDWSDGRAWRRTRRVIARIEHVPKGRNPRFIVTNLDDQPKDLYERVYCQCGRRLPVK